MSTKIGILGGTFDPIHQGHLNLATTAKSALGLDEVILVVANRNPLKKSASASAKDRVEMVRLAITDLPGLAVSDLEIQKGGPSYSVETIADFQAVRPADYWLILGSDALRGIQDWKQPERLIRMCRLGVAYRPGFDIGDTLRHLPPFLDASIDSFELDPNDVSSTDIRKRIATKQPLHKWVPPNVLRYITEHQLYRL